MITINIHGFEIIVDKIVYFYETEKEVLGYNEKLIIVSLVNGEKLTFRFYDEKKRQDTFDDLVSLTNDL